MFARLFPLKPEAIIEQSYSGVLNSLFLFPTSFIGENIEPGITGVLTNLRVRILFPLDSIKREEYRDKLLDQLHLRSNERDQFGWQLKLQKLLENPYFYFTHSIILAPVAEEIIFRGLLLPFTKYILDAMNIDPYYSVLLTSFAFGIAHREGMRLNASIAGYQWGKLTYNNGSIWASVAGHISQNFIGELYHSNKI